MCLLMDMNPKKNLNKESSVVGVARFELVSGPQLRTQAKRNQHSH